MKSMVTGASGFVGTHLLRFLQAEGVEIATHGPAQGIIGDHYDTPIEDIASLVDIVTRVQPDFIFHLAGVTIADDYSQFYRVNVQYAANLLRALELAGLSNRPVLLCGTAAEYGLVRPEEMPITEKTPALPYNHYSASKLAQTHLGLVLSNSGRHIVVVRPFNIIGPGMGAHLSVQAFAMQISEIARGVRPPVIEVGNLSSSRDFVDVGQIVRIYWRLLSTPAAFGRVVNICSGQPVKISEVLNRLIRISGLQIQERVDASRFKSIDVPLSYGDPSLLKTLIGTYPQRQLDDTLRDILAALMPLSA